MVMPEKMMSQRLAFRPGISVSHSTATNSALGTPSFLMMYWIMS